MFRSDGIIDVFDKETLSTFHIDSAETLHKSIFTDSEIKKIAYHNRGKDISRRIDKKIKSGDDKVKLGFSSSTKNLAKISSLDPKIRALNS